MYRLFELSPPLTLLCSFLLSPGRGPGRCRRHDGHLHQELWRGRRLCGRLEGADSLHAGTVSIVLCSDIFLEIIHDSRFDSHVFHLWKLATCISFCGRGNSRFAYFISHSHNLFLHLPLTAALSNLHVPSHLCAYLPFFRHLSFASASTQRACAGSNYSNSISPPACQQIISALKIILGEDGTDIGAHACLLSFEYSLNRSFSYLFFWRDVVAYGCCRLDCFNHIYLSAFVSIFLSASLPPHSQVSARFCSFATMPTTFAGVWKRWVCTSSARTILRSCQSCTLANFATLSCLAHV
jgi:hypothetical protein